MFLTGFADEAGAALDTQIKATCEVGWKFIETRKIDGKNLSTLTDDEFETLCGKLQDAGISFNCYGSTIAGRSFHPRKAEDFERSKELLYQARLYVQKQHHLPKILILQSNRLNFFQH